MKSLAQFLYLGFSTAASILSDWEQIHTTLSKYSLALDNRNSDRLSEVFTKDAIAAYGPGENLRGIDAITQACIESVANDGSQYILTVISIEFDDHGGTPGQTSTSTHSIT